MSLRTMSLARASRLTLGRSASTLLFGRCGDARDGVLRTPKAEWLRKWQRLRTCTYFAQRSIRRGFSRPTGSDIVGANEVSFGLVDYGRTLLRAPDVGQERPRLIDNSFQATAMFNYGIANHVTVGLSIPVNLMTSGEHVNAAGQPSTVGWSSTARLPIAQLYRAPRKVAHYSRRTGRGRSSRAARRARGRRSGPRRRRPDVLVLAPGHH